MGSPDCFPYEALAPPLLCQSSILTIKRFHVTRSSHVVSLQLSAVDFFSSFIVTTVNTASNPFKDLCFYCYSSISICHPMLSGRYGVGSVCSEGHVVATQQYEKHWSASNSSSTINQSIKGRILRWKGDRVE